MESFQAKDSGGAGAEVAESVEMLRFVLFRLLLSKPRGRNSFLSGLGLGLFLDIVIVKAGLV